MYRRPPTADDKVVTTYGPGTTFLSNEIPCIRRLQGYFRKDEFYSEKGKTYYFPKGPRTAEEIRQYMSDVYAQQTRRAVVELYRGLRHLGLCLRGLVMSAFDLLEVEEESDHEPMQ